MARNFHGSRYVFLSLTRFAHRYRQPPQLESLSDAPMQDPHVMCILLCLFNWRDHSSDTVQPHHQCLTSSKCAGPFPQRHIYIYVFQLKKPVGNYSPFEHPSGVRLNLYEAGARHYLACHHTGTPSHCTIRAIRELPPSLVPSPPHYILVTCNVYLYAVEISDKQI